MHFWKIFFDFFTKFSITKNMKYIWFFEIFQIFDNFQNAASFFQKMKTRNREKFVFLRIFWNIFLRNYLINEIINDNIFWWRNLIGKPFWWKNNFIRKSHIFWIPVSQDFSRTRKSLFFAKISMNIEDEFLAFWTPQKRHTAHDDIVFAILKM